MLNKCDATGVARLTFSVVLVQVAKDSFGGRIDVLVNNALARYQFNPASEQASIKTVTWEHFDEQFKGTVAGSVNAMKAVLPSMEEQSYGKVISLLPIQCKNNSASIIPLDVGLSTSCMQVINIGTNLVYNPVVTYYDYTASKVPWLLSHTATPFFLFFQSPRIFNLELPMPPCPPARSERHNIVFSPGCHGWLDAESCCGAGAQGHPRQPRRRR